MIFSQLQKSQNITEAKALTVVTDTIKKTD